MILTMHLESTALLLPSILDFKSGRMSSSTWEPEERKKIFKIIAVLTQTFRVGWAQLNLIDLSFYLPKLLIGHEFFGVELRQYIPTPHITEQHSATTVKGTQTRPQTPPTATKKPFYYKASF